MAAPASVALSNFAREFQLGPDARGPRVPESEETVAEFLRGLDVSEAALVPGFIDDCKHVFVENPFKGILPESVELTDAIRPLVETSLVARVADEEAVPCATVSVEKLPGPPPPAPFLDIILYRAAYLHAENAAKGRPEEASRGADWYVVMIKGQDEARELPMKPETLMRNQADGVPVPERLWKASAEYWARRVELRR